MHSVLSLSPPAAHRSVLTLQLLAFATNELSIRLGEALAELLNATLVRTSFHLILLPSRIPRLTRIRVCLQGNA
jgi:hypothetical protein